MSAQSTPVRTKVDVFENNEWRLHSAWARPEFAASVVRRLRDMGVYQGERVGMIARIRPETPKAA